MNLFLSLNIVREVTMQLCPIPKRGAISVEVGSLVVNHVAAVDGPLTRGWSGDARVWVRLQCFPGATRREEL